MRAPALALPLVLLAACGDGGDTAPDAAAPRVTWYQDVAPIVAEHCMGCHREGGIAPFAMTDYEDAADVAAVALLAVEQGIMPPWDAVDGDDCAPRHGWKNDPRLSADEIDVLRMWIEDGTPAGDPIAIPEPPSTTLGGVTHSAEPTTGHATRGDADEFICYVLDPGVTELGWMTGMQLVPGNPEVVHHAVTLVQQPGATLDAIKAERGVGVPFPCNDPSATFPEAYLVNVWTPGQEPMVTPPDIALPVLPGSHLIVQFHYHPGGQTHAPDVSRIDLRLGGTQPRMMWTIGAVGNAFQAPELLPGPNDPGGTPVFFVPREVADHRESMRFTIDTDTTERFPIFFAYPHMHYIGVGLKVRITRAAPAAGEPADECLVNVDRWDFDWQRTYTYDAALDDAPTIGDGDVVEIDCTYDNTLGNPFVQRALAELGLDEPVDVFLGEESLDEMCLAMFGIAFEPPPAGQAPPTVRFVPAAHGR